MPALDQRRPSDKAIAGAGQQVGPQDAVTHHLAGGDPQTAALGGLEEDVHGRGEVGAEDQRRRRARARQRGEELPGDDLGVRVLGEPGLLGQRALLSQSSSGMPSPAMRPDLRVVHVRVDQPGQQHPPRRSTTSSCRVPVISSANGPRAVITPSRTEIADVGFGGSASASTNGLPRGVHHGARGKASSTTLPDV